MTDPFRLAGLTGNLTNAGHLFSDGVVAYTTISDVRNMGSSFGRQYWLFKVQESRYLFWGMCHKACSPGGLSLNQMPAIVSEAIVKTLVQINSLLQDQDTLATKYGLERIADIQPTHVSLIRRESERQQNVVSRLHRSSSLLRKLQWVVRDHGQFAELTTQLERLVDALHEFLPVPAGPWVDDAITAQTLADTLINTGGAVNPVRDDPKPPMPQSSNLNGLQQASVAIAEGSKRESLENSPTFLPSLASTFIIDPHQLQIQDQTVRRKATLDLRSWALQRQTDPLSRNGCLMIEWRQYALGDKGQRKMDLQARIEALVRMLREKPRSDSFRVLDCLGYFLDDSSPRFGLTFHLPSNYNLGRDPAPMSLFEVLNDYPNDVPYLGDRFRLAYLLAESIHALHSAFWLHKSVCSRNILLFGRNPYPVVQGISQRPVSLEAPYFAGFALSRPDGPAMDSSLSAPLQEVAIYRHMDVQGAGGRPISRYRAIYDVYSLGILLVEIGTWRTIQRFYPQAPAPDFDFARYLVEKVVPRLGVSMGENYMNVVRKCLEGSFERLTGFNLNEYDSMSYKNCVREGLLWEVVDVLRNCRV
jgi:Prion-inhibition and propagation